MFSLCSICRPEREGSGGAASLPAAAPTAAPGQQTLGRGLQRAKSEVRVIEVRGPSGALPSFGHSSSMPSGLLAAASRRLAAAQEAEAAAAAAAEAAGSGAVATAIVQAYMQAIKESNAKWASAPEVAQLFAEGAVMVAADKQAFHGRPVILRRLNQGVEQLAKMAGDAKQLPTFEMSAPSATKDGATVVGLKFTRGLQRMTFTLTFRLQGGQITWLSNARS